MEDRVLCLGNDLLADDAFGPLVAGRLRGLRLPGVEVIESAASGFCLLDALLECRRLLVIDTVVRGGAPGRIHLLREKELCVLPGSSPHYVGLFEALDLARALELPVPAEVAILAVEAADCFTVGGSMNPAVRAAVEPVVELVRRWLLAPEAIQATSEQPPERRQPGASPEAAGLHPAERGQLLMPG